MRCLVYGGPLNRSMSHPATEARSQASHASRPAPAHDMDPQGASMQCPLRPALVSPLLLYYKSRSMATHLCCPNRSSNPRGCSCASPVVRSRRATPEGACAICGRGDGGVFSHCLRARAFWCGGVVVSDLYTKGGRCEAVARRDASAPCVGNDRQSQPPTDVPVPPRPRQRGAGARGGPTPRHRAKGMGSFRSRPMPPFACREGHSRPLHELRPLARSPSARSASCTSMRASRARS